MSVSSEDSLCSVSVASGRFLPRPVNRGLHPQPITESDRLPSRPNPRSPIPYAVRGRTLPPRQRAAHPVLDSCEDSGRFPIVLGGDCSIVLGPMLALRRRGRYGLVFIDGHADFQHPSDEPNGEVASLDLALVTGRGPEILTDLDGLRPLVRDEDVALVGYRVFGDNDHVLDEHVRDTAVTVVDGPEVRESGAASALGKALATVTRLGVEGFWVHLDVDVLDDDLMPAVDYRHPGGLTWEEAAEILRGLLNASGARPRDHHLQPAPRPRRKPRPASVRPHHQCRTGQQNRVNR